jgi:hypothetical protein
VTASEIMSYLARVFCMYPWWTHLGPAIKLRSSGVVMMTAARARLRTRQAVSRVFRAREPQFSRARAEALACGTCQRSAIFEPAAAALRRYPNMVRQDRHLSTVRRIDG